MKKEEINHYLSNLKSQLELSTKTPMLLTLEWERSFPKEPGVYCIYCKGKMIYVGETENLRKRMNHLRNSRHHVLRRTLGEKLYSSRNDFEKATSKKKFPADIEIDLEVYMKKELSVSCIPVYLGRKELEDFILNGIDADVLNKRGKKEKK